MMPLLYGVMAYESAAVAKIAKEKWDYVVHALQSRYDFELRLWKFDILRIRELRNEAINDATKAQLIFVATHGAGELPLHVKEWIEQWLALKNRVQASRRLLAFLFDSSSDRSWVSAFPTFAYLQQAARRSSMDFISSATPIQSELSAIRLQVSTRAMPSCESNFSPGRNHVTE
jgi:hypothetical protein